MRFCSSSELLLSLSLAHSLFSLFSLSLSVAKLAIYSRVRSNSNGRMVESREDLQRPVQPPQVKASEASGRGKAASTRGTRYIALHPRHCAGFSAVRVSEMLYSRAQRADDRTRGTGRGLNGGGDNAILSPIRNCRRRRRQR